MLSIGELSRRTATKVQTIRYYEQVGLMREAERSAGGQRRYAERDLERLAFIRHARELGFPLDAIRELLDLADNPKRPCEEADAIARRQLIRVEQRLRRLEALRAELTRMLEECAGGRVSDCRVIEVLRDHSQCLTDHREVET
jgi:DNA-binding transcriptional MerR regulator